MRGEEKKVKKCAQGSSSPEMNMRSKTNACTGRYRRMDVREGELPQARGYTNE